MNAELLKGNLDLLLLSIVGRGPAHGYAVIAALRADSNGLFDLPEGTVYPALHRLERNGLLGSAWATEHGRRRRIYELSSAGREALRTQQSAWQTSTAGIQSRLQGTA